MAKGGIYRFSNRIAQEAQDNDFVKAGQKVVNMAKQGNQVKKLLKPIKSINPKNAHQSSIKSKTNLNNGRANCKGSNKSKNATKNPNQNKA